MASPFSTNELFLRSDRIAFGKVPPEVASREERLLIVPDLPGYKLFFGLSSLVSTSAVTGTLEAIYPQNASFTFDNQTKQLGIGISSPQYGLDIATTTGVRISGGMLIANALGLQSVPTAALISTLPASVFAPGSIPPTAIASTGTIAGISVPTSALFSTLPTQLFAPSSIPLLALQSSGIVYASSFIANSLYGDGYNVSNIPLANINADIVGNFFKPNTISLSSLASTGQLWIKDGSVLVPYLSAPQIITSSITANYVSSQTIRVGDIQASSFTAGILNFQNLSSLTLATSSILVGGGITANYFSGDGDGLTNLNPDQLNTVIPSDKFGYRLIAWDAINPYGAFVWIAGSATFEAGAPVTVQGTLTVNGATTLNTVTANLYTGNGSGLYNLNAVSSLSLRSTVAGLGTAGYLSTGALGVITENLVSTVVGLGSIGYISSSQLLSTISSLGSLGYVSTSQLTSTVRGLGSVGYISSASLTSSLISTTIAFQTAGFLSSQNLLSTVEGLGSVGYISSASLASSFISTTNFIGAAISSFSSAFGPGGGTISLANITSTVEGLGSAGYLSTLSLTSSLISTTNFIGSAISSFSTAFGPGGTDITAITSTVEGLGSSGYVSTLSLTSSLISTTNFIGSAISSFSTAFGPGGTDITAITSTVEGLGSSGYVSTLSLTSSLISTTNFIGSAISSFSTAFGPGGTDITAITSTVEGLGSSGYISSVSLQSSLTSTTKGLETYISSFIDPQELASSVLQFISSTYLTSQLTSTVTGLGSAGYISTASLTSSLLSTNNSIGVAISSFSTAFGPGGTNMTTLASTVEGLGSIGYISAGTLSTALISTTTGLQRAGFISSANLLSTVEGLGSIGYISAGTLSTALISTTMGLQRAGFISSANLLSTVEGLGSIGYISAGTLSTALISTTTGLQRAGFISSANLLSTVTGLGSIGYLSTASLTSSLISTTTMIGLSFSSYSTSVGGSLATVNLTSTVTGLGSIGYLSTASLTSSLISTTRMIGMSFSSYSTSVGGSLATVNLTSTVTGLGSIGYVSTTALGAFLSTISTSYRNQFDTVTSVISALTVSSLTFGTGDGFLSMPDIRPTAMSTLVTQTSSLQAFNLQIGATSTLTAIQFYGLQGNFLNTVIAERSLAAGSQEFLVFKGSSSADQIRFQTTGIFEIETGVSSRLWSTVTQNATPSFIIDINSNVGIQTASPGATLDVAGTARAVNLSSQRLLVSSINDSLLLSLVSLTSTVTGLGSIGYISTPSLISTTNFVSLSFSSFSSAVGPGGGITTTNLQSTVEGLGSVGYISAGTLSTVLISTTNFISLSFSSFSTGIGGGGGGGLTTGNLTSTVAGLGTVGYLSSIPSILSTSAFFTSSAVISTATIGIMSSLVTNASTANINIATTSSVTTNTITIGTGGGWILTSPIQTAALSTNTLWADTSYVTTENVTTGIISTVTTNNITLGTGGGWLATSPIQTSIVSSIYMFANQPYFDTVNVGSVSTVNSLQYYGLFGNYNNTVLAEISTGGGTQELLVFKGSSSSDRVRVQTTGNFVVETGVSARLFNSNTIPTLSNATPAFIVNTSSNVGIQTASPGATLDVAGTGRFVLVSTQQLNFSSLGNANLRLLSLSTGYTSLSSLNIIDPFNAAINFLTVSSGILLLNGSAISGGGGGGAGVSQIVAGTNISISPVGGTGVVTINSTGPSLTELYSTVGGLGSIGYISSASMASSFISTTNFIGSAISSFSTAFGPGGISLVNITSTVQGLGSAGYISAGTLSTALISTTIGLQTAGFLSSANLLSTVGGLGSIGYISTASLISTTSNITYSYGEGLSTLSTAIYSAPFIYPGQLLYLNYGISTGLTSNYRALQTTPTPLNAGYLVTTPLAGNSISTVAVFQSDFFVPTFIPAGFWENRLFAYASGTSVTAFTELYSRSPAGVETLIKTTSTATTTILPGASPQENIINMNVPYTAISTGHSIVWKVFGSNANAAARDLFTNFENGNTYSYLITTFGGAAGYDFPAAFSTLALFTSNTSNYFSSQIVSTNLNLISTVGGLGSSGYVSSASLTSSLVSTTVAFQTAGFISSANLLPFAASLGSLGYISSASLTSSLVSTTVAFQTAGFLSSANLLSTVGGLGSIGYISTTRLISTVVGLGSAGYLSTIPATSIPSTLSTSQFLTSSVVASSITTSSLQVNSLTIGTGTGWVNLGPLQTVAISSIQDNTNALYANTSFFGTTSTATALQFYGLFGNYNNTVLAEVSTGAGTQELLAFKGSSSSDRVRVQTTGAFVVETGVSARLWSGTTIPTLSNTTPAFIINSSSNVGIQTASPGTALDVVGTARATILSSLAVYTSSLFAPYVFTPQFFTF